MRELGKVDAALLPIGGTFTMDIEEAVEAAIAIQPRVVIPMHRSKADPQDYMKKVEAISNIKVDGFVKSRHSGENRSPETL